MGDASEGEKLHQQAKTEEERRRHCAGNQAGFDACECAFVNREGGVRQRRVMSMMMSKHGRENEEEKHSRTTQQGHST